MGLARYGTYPPRCFVLRVFRSLRHIFLEILRGRFFLKVFERNTVILFIHQDNHPRRLHGICEVVQEFTQLQLRQAANLSYTLSVNDSG